MCFGEKVEEAKTQKIVDVQRRFLLGLVGEFQTLNLGPSWLTKILFRKRWDEFFKIQKEQTELFLPLIRARKQVMLIKILELLVMFQYHIILLIFEYLKLLIGGSHSYTYKLG